MATYLLAWELGGGVGHCVNFLPIAERLLADGHRVYFAARDLVAARHVFQDLPIRLLPAPFLIGSCPDKIRQVETFAQILHNTGFGDTSQLQALTTAWRNLIELIQPDVIVCEHAPMALFTSRFYDVRRCVLGTGFFSPPDLSPLPNLRPDSDGIASPQAIACETAITQRLNKLLASENKPQLQHLAQLYAQVDANLLLTLPELDHYPQRVGGEYFGSWSPPGGQKPEWPSRKGKRIFAYLKPPHKDWRLSDTLLLLRELKQPTLVYVPNGESAWLEKHSTPFMSIVTQRVDMQCVVQQCDLAVHNGNAGTSTELLLAGIPQLLIPLHLEQAVFSQQVVRLGAGLMARPDLPVQQTIHLMNLLNNNEYLANAQDFAKRYSTRQSDHQLQHILRHLQPN